MMTGCVVRTDHKMSGPRSLLVWSKGDVYLDAAGTDIKPTERAIGTSGKPGPVFYWIDDEDDFAKHVGKRVEIVGELNDDIDEGEIEVAPSQRSLRVRGNSRPAASRARDP